MSERDLRTLLRTVHAELEKTDSVDDESRRLLRDLMDDIHEVLDRREAAAEKQRAAQKEAAAAEPRGEDDSAATERGPTAEPRAGAAAARVAEAELHPFRSRLHDVLRRFEVRHPTVTEAISRLLDALPK